MSCHCLFDARNDLKKLENMTFRDSFWSPVWGSNRYLVSSHFCIEKMLAARQPSATGSHVFLQSLLIFLLLELSGRTNTTWKYWSCPPTADSLVCKWTIYLLCTPLSICVTETGMRGCPQNLSSFARLNHCDNPLSPRILDTLSVMHILRAHHCGSGPKLST